MPIVEIEVVASERDHWSADDSVRIANEFAAIFGAKPNATWVKMRRVSVADYAENNVDASQGTDIDFPSNQKSPANAPSVFPVFVNVIKRDKDPVDVRRVESRRLAEVVSEILDRPLENTHIIYQPPGSGRVAFGGILLD